MGEIARLKNMKISIYPFSDNGRSEHPPAHIHVSCNGYIYKFNIATYEQMFDKQHTKEMPKKEKKILIL